MTKINLTKKKFSTKNLKFLSTHTANKFREWEITTSLTKLNFLAKIIQNFKNIISELINFWDKKNSKFLLFSSRNKIKKLFTKKSVRGNSSLDTLKRETTTITTKKDKITQQASTIWKKKKQQAVKEFWREKKISFSKEKFF